MVKAAFGTRTFRQFQYPISIGGVSDACIHVMYIAYLRKGGVWDAHISSISHLLCMFIDKESFLQLLHLYPEDLSQV